MSSPHVDRLPWLLAAPESLGARLAAVRDAGAEAATATLMEVAGTALNGNQLNMLAREIDHLKARGGSLDTLQAVRLGIVGENTTSLLLAAIRATGLRYRLDIEVIEAPYDHAIQEATDPASIMARERPDVVFLMIGENAIGMGHDAVVPDPAGVIETALARLRRLRDGVRDNTGALLMINTVPPPAEALFGNIERGLVGTAGWLVERFNTGLREWLVGEPDLLFDLSHLASTVGLASWRDSKMWHLAKMPFDERYVPLVADQLVRVLASQFGLARRVLVMDLDNTLWGGVIGDDGLDNIVVGQGDGLGEAYLAVQAAAQRLRRRGVVLCVCSKNTDEIARQAFREHPDMILREDDITVFQANWSDKPSNLRAIAKLLSLDLKSFVFLDDNPVERAQVRAELPMVAVPELPSDPSLFAPTLLAAGYFEPTVYSEEDAQRADYYRMNARRAELAANTASNREFLASLAMTAKFQVPTAPAFNRVGQLVNKSNQFNLTTRRHDQATLRSFAETPSHVLFQVRLQDQFGDNGVVSVVHLVCDGEAAEIETWVMSCRVLGRWLEEAIIAVAAGAAKAQGARRLTGEYLPTERNGLVRDLYARLGFDGPEPAADGGSRWSLELDGYVPGDLPMAIEVDPSVPGAAAAAEAAG